MKKRDILRRQPKLVSGLVLTSLLASGVIGGAFAQGSRDTLGAPLKLRTDYFGYSASVSTRAGYSDNINLAPDGFEDDETILSTLFTGGAVVSNNRVTALFLGDIDVSYLTGDSDFRVNQSIGATSTFTAAEDWLYLDVSGQTSRQLIGDNARFSGNLNAARDNRANVHSYSVSPYIYRELEDSQSVELRYRFSQVFVDDDSATVNPSRGNFLNDSETQEVTAAYDTGDSLGQLRLRAVAYGNRTDEDGSDVFDSFEYEQGSIYGEVRYTFNNKFGVTGAVGYDEIDTSDSAQQFFDDELLSGLFWRAGFIASPNDRFTAQIEYGERYDDEFVEASINYQVSKRMFFSAGAGRSFETRAETNNFNLRANQTRTLSVIDQLRAGGEVDARSLIDTANRLSGGGLGNSAQTIGLGVRDSAFASLSYTADRTQFALTGSYNDTDFGFRTTETLAGTLSAEHRLSRRVTGYGSASYRFADTEIDVASCVATPTVFGLDTDAVGFDAPTDCAIIAATNGETHTLIGTIGGSYRLMKNVSTFVEFSHAERFADSALLEYGENSVLAGVTVDF